MTEGLSQFKKIEKLVIQDQNFLFTLASYVFVLTIYINLSAFQSWPFGIVASLMYSLINGIFLGNAFFKKEDAFVRLLFGILLLIVLVGFLGWLAVISYNLDVMQSTMVLFIAATLSSLTNRRVKNRNVT